MSTARVIAVLLGATLWGCSGSDSITPADGGVGVGATCSSSSSFPTTPLATVTSDNDKLEVAIHAAPYSSLVAGLQCIELVVTDASSGAGVDGLTVTMTPWMPAMGHGASVTPQLTALGQGRYVFTDVSLFMPGEWQLRTQFTGQVTDSVEPTFNVD